MTKIFCFVHECNESEFGVARPNQAHLNAHLSQVHGLSITAANARHYKRRQNEAWQARYNVLLAERSRETKRLRDQFIAFQKDPSLPLPTEPRDEALEIAWVTLMDTVDDEELVEEAELNRGADAKARSERFGRGPAYAASLRSSVYREQKMKEQASEILLSMKSSKDSAHRLPQGSRSAVALPNGNAFAAEEASTPPRKEDSPVETRKPEEMTTDPPHTSEDIERRKQ